MIRTALFPHFRARLKNVTPNPKEVFHALAMSFREALATKCLVLPTLEEVLAQYEP